RPRPHRLGTHREFSISLSRSTRLRPPSCISKELYRFVFGSLPQALFRYWALPATLVTDLANLLSVPSKAHAFHRPPTPPVALSTGKVLSMLRSNWPANETCCVRSCFMQ